MQSKGFELINVEEAKEGGEGEKDDVMDMR